MALGQNSRTPPPVWHYITYDLQIPHSSDIVPHKLQPRLSLLPRFKSFPRVAAPNRHFAIELTVSEIERI